MTNPRQRNISGGRKSIVPPVPATPPLRSPTEQGISVPQIGRDEEISQETGTTKNVDRANWSHQMKLYLIGLLKQHDLPKYRTHNAWSKEAWTSMVGQFNSKFSLSYSIAQVKQKEQDLKKDFRAIKDLRDESGFGWDSSRMMVTAPESVWKGLDERRNRDSLVRWRDKSFPYFDDLYALYDGRYAEGRSCHGMDHYTKKSKLSSDVPASQSSPLHIHDGPLQSTSPSQAVLDGSSLVFDVDGTREETNWFGADEFSPLPNLVNDSTFESTPEGAQALHSSNLDTLVPEQSLGNQHRTYCPSSSTREADAKGRKRQKTRNTISTNDFHERYLDLKKEEIDRFAAIAEKKLEDPYSIKKCVAALEGLHELQMEEMIKAADIFKDSPANRETFLSFSRDETCLGWLRNQI